MITTLYAALCALLLVKLSLAVIKLRRKHKVSLGDGGVEDLVVAIATHSNACQYMPISLLLIFTLEQNQANIWIIHFVGLALLTGRLFHAHGMWHAMSARVLGMQITIYNIIAMSILNLIYLPYSQLI